VLRALAREPAAVEAFRAEIGLARGADRRLDAAADRLAKELVTADEASARRVVESMALVLQGSLLVRHARRTWRTPSARRGWPVTSRVGARAGHPARRAGHGRDRRAGHSHAHLTGSSRMMGWEGNLFETRDTLFIMTTAGAPLVARLHVDFGHVSSAVCMRG
jgi:hypothetical protein